MITTPAEYFANLYQIQENNPPRIAVLPTAETIHEINLDTREIDSPKFLSVAHDHQSETIYFKVDRYYDYMDLSTTTCIVQYVNANNESRIYVVPFYDTMTCSLEKKMLLPWCIDGSATAAAGPVQYSIRFYKVHSNKESFAYSLNTKTATSEVLHGMDITKEDPDNIYDISADAVSAIYAEIDKLRKTDVYWTYL